MITVIVGLLMSASQANAPTVEPPVLRRAVVTARLEIPDEIAPAVVPYMGCLFARYGVEVRGPSDPRPKEIARGGDCSINRELAARKADKRLRQIGGRSSEERQSFIERTLVAMEEFAKSSATPIAPESIPDAPNK